MLDMATSIKQCLGGRSKKKRVDLSLKFEKNWLSRVQKNSAEDVIKIKLFQWLFLNHFRQSDWLKELQPENIIEISSFVFVQHNDLKTSNNELLLKRFKSTKGLINSLSVQLKHRK